MIIRETEDFLDYRGWCEGCDHPKFRMLFGPLLYPKANWQGQDIVNEPFVIPMFTLIKHSSF